jgi:hypothetical protein
MKKNWLWVILLISKQLVWTAFIPAWQFPDEQAHFAQVQNVVELNKLQVFDKYTTSREIYESEKLLHTNRDERGNNDFTYHPEFNIPYTNSKIGSVENSIAQFPIAYRSELVINEATGYPPLYYQFASFFYRLVYSDNLLVRLFVVRLVNLFFFLATMVIVYKIGKLLFPNNPVLQCTLLLFVSFQPMFSFVSAGVTSDNLFNLFFTFGIYIGLLIVKEGLRLRLLFIMAGLVFLRNQIKEQGTLLLPLLLLPLTKAFLALKRYKLIIAIVGISLLMFLIRTTIKAVVNGEQFLPDIGSSRYLTASPNLTFPFHITTTLIHTYREVLPWYWGVFRWLSFTYPRNIHRSINLTLFAGILGLVILFIKKFKKKKIVTPWSYVVFLIYTAVIYFFGITVYDFLFIKSRGFSLGIQGRYFFPTIVAHMSLLLVGLATILPKKINQFGIKLTGVAMILLHNYAFYHLVSSYYVTKPVSQFFIQVSQYKPTFFKSPNLEILLIFYIVVLGIGLWNYLGLKGESHET